ncbi:MAG: dual specificity protein phosphatase family protein [Methylohalobius sp.]
MLQTQSNPILTGQGVDIQPLFTKDGNIHLAIESPGSRWVEHIFDIAFSPPLPNDFLLPHFPLTLALTVASEGEEIAWPEMGFTLAITGPQGWKQSLPLRVAYQQGQLRRLKAMFLPPWPGKYRLCAQLVAGPKAHELFACEAEVAPPRANERWTLGPLICEADPYLYLGNAAAAANPKRPEDGQEILKAHGIEAVVNAAEERDTQPALLDTGIEYAHFPFRDFSHHPMDEARLWQALEWIAHRIERKRPVLVHCHAGIGRSGSLVAAYLLLFRYPKRSFDEVVEQLNQRFKPQGHRIYPHLGLPETVARLRCKRFQGFVETVGKVHQLAFDSLQILGPKGAVTAEIAPNRVYLAHLGYPIALRVKAAFESLPPRGVYLFTNLNRDEPFEKILMRAVAGEEGGFEAWVTPQRRGKFWLTACATPRRYDHDLVAKWVGYDLLFQVV